MQRDLAPSGAGQMHGDKTLSQGCPVRDLFVHGNRQFANGRFMSKHGHGKFFAEGVRGALVVAVG